MIGALILLCGIVAGFSFGLTAGGGSVVAVPLLVYVIGVQAHKGVCVSMVTMSVLAAIASIRNLRRHRVSISAALTIAVFGIAFAPLGAWLNRQVSERTLLMLFAAVMLLIGVRMFRRPDNHENHLDGTLSARPVARSRKDWKEALALIGIGALSGTLAGLLGIGGGFVIVPGLVLFRRLEIHNAITTAFLSISLISAAAATAHFLAGQRVSPTVSVLFMSGGAVGMLCGLALGERLAGKRLQRIFAIVLMAVSAAMLIHNLFRQTA